MQYFRFVAHQTATRILQVMQMDSLTQSIVRPPLALDHDNLVLLRHGFSVARDLHHARSLPTALPIIRIPLYSAALPGSAYEVSTLCNPSCPSFRNRMTAPLGCRVSLWRFRLRFPESFQTWARTLLTRSAAEMPLGGCLLRSANERDLCTRAMIHCLIPSPFTVSL